MIGKETVATIGAWLDTIAPPTNGKLSGVRSQALKLVGEANELAHACGCTPAERHAATFVKGNRGDWHERQGEPHNVGKEIADCCIVLAVLANRGGFDIGTEVDAKMKVNRDRAWKADADGKAQHVEVAS